MSEYVEHLLAASDTVVKPAQKKVLVEEIGVEKANDPVITDVSSSSANTSVNHNNLPSREEEGPSLLEMMMAAQREAAKEKLAEKKESKEAKPFSHGFKKGFLSSKTSQSKNNDIVHVTAKNSTSTKETVLENVKQALRKEQEIAREENEKKYGPLSQFLNNNGNLI